MTDVGLTTEPPSDPDLDPGGEPYSTPRPTEPDVDPGAEPYTDPDPDELDPFGAPDESDPDA